VLLFFALPGGVRVIGAVQREREREKQTGEDDACQFSFDPFLLTLFLIETVRSIVCIRRISSDDEECSWRNSKRPFKYHMYHLIYSVILFHFPTPFYSNHFPSPNLHHTHTYYANLPMTNGKLPLKPPSTTMACALT